MDESFDCKIRKLLEEGKKLGFNPKKPEEIIEDDNSNMQDNCTFPLDLESFSEFNQSSILQQELANFSFLNFNKPSRETKSSPILEKSTTKIDTSINSLNNEFYRLIDCSYAEKKETVSKSGDGNVYRKKKNNAVLKTAYESSQMEVKFLNEKLKQSNKINETLKENFQTAVIHLQEELKNSNLKNNLLSQNKQSEMENQQKNLVELEEKVKDLMCTNKSHETCWLETNKNMEKLKTENEKYSVCISSIIDLLKSCENKVPSFEKKELSQYMENLDCKNIVNALEYVLMQVCGGSDLLRRKVFDLELERNAYKEEHQKEINNSTALQLEFETQRVMSEYCNEETVCKNQELRERIKVLEGEISLQSEEIKKHNEENCLLTEKYKKEVDENCELMDTLEKNVEEAKSDVKSANEVVQELRAENESCNLKIEEQQMQIDRLQQKLKNISSFENEMKDKENLISNLKSDFENKCSEVEILQETVAEIKRSAAAEVNEKVKETEQLVKNKMQSELDNVNSLKQASEGELASIKLKCRMVEEQLATVVMEKTNLNCKLHQSFQQVDELSLKLEKNEDLISNLYETHDSIHCENKRLTDENLEFSKQNQELKNEISSFNSRMNEKQDEIQDLVNKINCLNQDLDQCKIRKLQLISSENDLKKKLDESIQKANMLESDLNSLEKDQRCSSEKLQKLLDDKKKFVELADQRQNKIVEMIESKCSLEKENVEIRSQVGHLIHERDSLDRELKSTIESHLNRTDNLKSVLKSQSSDLNMLKEKFDLLGRSDECKSLAVAKIQNEVTEKRALVDSLQYQLHGANSRSNSLEVENKRVKKNFFQLVSKFDQLESELMEMKMNIRGKVKQEKLYKAQIEKLQSTLNKAVKNREHKHQIMEEKQQQMFRVNQFNQLLHTDSATNTNYQSNFFHQIMSKFVMSVDKKENLGVVLSNTEVEKCTASYSDIGEKEKYIIEKEVLKVLKEFCGLKRCISLKNNEPLNEIERNKVTSLGYNERENANKETSTNSAFIPDIDKNEMLRNQLSYSDSDLSSKTRFSRTF